MLTCGRGLLTRLAAWALAAGVVLPTWAGTCNVPSGSHPTAGAALRDIISRKVSHDIPALVVTFNTLLTVMLFALAGSLVFEEMVVPAPWQLGLMLMAGFFLMCGHFFVFLAFRFANARLVAPFTYSFTLWAVLFGFVIFGDIPNSLAVAGMALVMVTGLAVLVFEGRERARENLAL